MKKLLLTIALLTTFTAQASTLTMNDSLRGCYQVEKYKTKATNNTDYSYTIIIRNHLKVLHAHTWTKGGLKHLKPYFVRAEKFVIAVSAQPTNTIYKVCPSTSNKKLNSQFSRWSWLK